MKFYIVKKDSRTAAIPAEQSMLEEYQKQGYQFVQVIAARDEVDAIQRTKPNTKATKSLLFIICSITLGCFLFFLT